MKKGPFSETSSHDIFTDITKRAFAQVNVMPAEDFISNTDDMLVDVLLAKYVPLSTVIHSEDKVLVDDPEEISVSYQANDAFGEPYTASSKKLKFTVEVPIEGALELFRVQPSSARLHGMLGDCNFDWRISNNKLLMDYQQAFSDAAAIEKVISGDLEIIGFNANSLNREIDIFSINFRNQLTPKVAARREEALKNKSIVEGLSIPIKKREDSAVEYMIQPKAVYVVNKKSSTQHVESNTYRDSSDAPDMVLSQDSYEDILVVMNSMSLAMERSPSTFKKLKEPEIRDFFLILLNGHYEGNATSETFNGEGKTDLLLRYKNANVFIAECKFWKGEKSLLDAIDQIMGYVTWRDTKTAVTVFYKDKNMQTILAQLPEIIKKHPHFKSLYSLKSSKLPSESVLACKFTHPQDSGKEMFLTVMFYHIPQL